MDLSGLRRVPEELPAPAPAPRAGQAGQLRAVRLIAREEPLPESLDLPDLPVFESGEEISAEERESDNLNFDPEDLGPLEHHGFPPYDEHQPVHEAIEKAVREQFGDTSYLDTETEVFVPSENGGSMQPRGTRHLCIVTPCGWYLDVPPIETPSIAHLMGAGPGLAAVEQAREVEQLLTEHLTTHSVLEWARALKAAQDERDAARSSTGVITSGYAPPAEGIIPGPARRDPEREAAVRALDARLGRGSPPPATPQAQEDYDNRLRAARDAKRARSLTPYDLTPQWSQDQGTGVVGIKR